MTTLSIQVSFHNYCGQLVTQILSQYTCIRNKLYLNFTIIISVITCSYKYNYTISVTSDKRRDKPISEAEKVGPSLV